MGEDLVLQETLPGSLHTRRPSISVPLRGRIASDFVSESSFIARGRDFSDRKAVTGCFPFRRTHRGGGTACQGQGMSS